jgi:hypothetical protein
MGWLVPFFRFPLVIAFLCCMGFFCIHCQLDAPDVSTTRQIAGAINEARVWSPLFKLCVGEGTHNIVVNYFFPAAASAVLSPIIPYNMTNLKAPWVLLYPEANWQEAFFYIVILFTLRSLSSAAAVCVCVMRPCCRAIATAV